MISCIYPSRGRAEKALHTCAKWIVNALPWEHDANLKYQFIISVDKDDPQLSLYKKLFKGITEKGVIYNGPMRVYINDNSSVVQATNTAATKAEGDILIYMSDDFSCPEHWNKLVLAEFAKYSGPTLIKVDDCLQKFTVPVLTIPIMNRELYNKLGYFWHPGYKSMFVDEHLYWRSKKLNALQFAPHIKFEHQHVSVGKAENDETYRRSAANWNQGKELFAKHKAAGFIE